MENNKELIATSCETLCRLFKCQHVSALLNINFIIINYFKLLQDSLIRQSLECNLIPYLVNLLESRIEFSDNPSMVWY